MPAIACIGHSHKGICDHGLPCCPHVVTGVIVSGSGDVKTNGIGVALLGSEVIHDCPHCGTGYISSASGSVFADGIPIAREGDEVTYPKGKGVIISASGNVFAG